jgi:GT2 family glycosyltransferase
MLVRRTAVEAAGLMSDVFMNGDDVEWCLRIARETGLGIAAIPASRAIHPHPDRMRTGARYYAARNAFAVIDSATAGQPEPFRRRVRRRRAWREVFRAAAQLMVGRDDLANLHLRALRDVAQDRVTGPAPEGAISLAPFRPREDLAKAIRESLSSSKRRGRVLLRRTALADPATLVQELHRLCIDPLLIPPDEPRPLRTILSRLLRAPQGPLAVVSARARPGDWLLAPTTITVAPEGFVVSRITRFKTALALARLVLSAIPLVRTISNRPLPAWQRSPERCESPASAHARSVPQPASSPASQSTTPKSDSPRTLSLAVIVLSFNRWPHLQRTLDRLLEDPATRDSHIIVVDNASLDGTPTRLRAEYPTIDFLPLDHNRGVAAFNRAARRATEDLLLILDDDAWPEQGVLNEAIHLLSERPDLAAIPLHPRHPADGQSEWPFAESLADPALAPIADRFPIMGCANLVRRDAWERVSGYDEAFFLYRNDADLAMKLLAAGFAVHFNPAWTAWHDSEFTARKSRRWFHLATRNWVWLCRRHGTGLTRAKMIFLGSLNAHRLARFSILDHLAAFRGLREGLRTRVPSLSHFVVMADRQGRALRDLLSLRLAHRRPSSLPAEPRP